MHLPGTPSLVFLAVILILLPLGALRSMRRLKEMRDPDGNLPELSREGILVGTMVVQIVILVLAWLVGRGFGFQIFADAQVGPRELIAAVMAFAICLLLKSAARVLQTPDQRRRLFVYRLVPRTRREWGVWTAAVLVAGVSEEAAYRGVGMAILWYSLGNPWIAALICAIAFALAHSTQGWKSGVVIFVMAVVFHALVAVTGTLLLAMGVHAAYDFVAGWLISREAVQFDRDQSSTIEGR